VQSERVDFRAIEDDARTGKVRFGDDHVQVVPALHKLSRDASPRKGIGLRVGRAIPAFAGIGFAPSTDEIPIEVRRLHMPDVEAIAGIGSNTFQRRSTIRESLNAFGSVGNVEALCVCNSSHADEHEADAETEVLVGSAKKIGKQRCRLHKEAR
jgi:hypothetical protein